MSTSPRSISPTRFFLLFIAVVAVAFLSGCGRKTTASDQDLPLIRLQTDWYPQAEHGGFYHALVHGYYADEGLNVEILPGGVNFMGALKVTEGQAEFAMHRADAILKHIEQGMPLQIVFATLQHDPQGILMHASNPISDFAGLDGQTVMAMPGGTWIEYLKKRFNVEPRIIPHDKGMVRFLSDPSFMQQCMATSEPYFARVNGVEPKVLLIRDSGFDPYHVVYTNSNFAAKHPELVERFRRASIKGWINYLTQDPSRTHELIKERNPRQTDELLNFSRTALVEGGFAFGEGDPSTYGNIDPERMAALERQMRELEMLK